MWIFKTCEKWFPCYQNSQWARTFNKVQAKKLVKSKKSISWNFFWPNSIFCHFKNGKKWIFDLGKSLKLPKMQFHGFFLIYLISWVFCQDFFKFSGPLCRNCVKRELPASTRHKNCCCCCCCCVVGDGVCCWYKNWWRIKSRRSRQRFFNWMQWWYKFFFQSSN